MMTYISDVAGMVSTGILFYAGIGHARSARTFSRIVAAHGLIPSRVASAVARVVIVVELVVGGVSFGVVASSQNEELGRLLLLCCVGVYGAFLVYDFTLLRRGVTLTCGCSAGEAPSSKWSLVRSGILLGASIVGLFPSSVTSSASMEALDVVLLCVSSAAIGMIVWTLPAAMTTVTYQEVPTEAGV